MITGDIKGSRAFDPEAWRIIQRKIKTALTELNKSYSSDLLRDFTITLDDEVQGVLHSPEKSYDIFVRLQDSIPVEFRCGIGIGKIEVVASEITEMRGESFFRSREALESTKNRGYPVIVKSSDEQNNVTDEAINAILGLIATIQSTWTDRQREVVTLCRVHDEYTYSDIARELNVSKQSISQVVRAAHWSAIQQGERAIRRLLQELPAHVRIRGAVISKVEKLDNRT
ncbi:MAG: hypothetical protein JW945_00025 [Methanomicrobia archaeon]|nr:hypothetical protein [Methanomicrobia archaeon]